MYSRTEKCKRHLLTTRAVIVCTRHQRLRVTAGVHGPYTAVYTGRTQRCVTHLLSAREDGPRSRAVNTVSVFRAPVITARVHWSKCVIVPNLAAIAQIITVNTCFSAVLEVSLESARYNNT